MAEQQDVEIYETEEMLKKKQEELLESGNWVYLMKLDEPIVTGTVYSLECLLDLFKVDMETLKKGVDVRMGTEIETPKPVDENIDQEFYKRYATVDTNMCTGLISKIRLVEDDNDGYHIEGYYIPIPGKLESDELTFLPRAFGKEKDSKQCLTTLITFDVFYAGKTIKTPDEYHSIKMLERLNGMGEDELRNVAKATMSTESPKPKQQNKTDKPKRDKRKAKLAKLSKQKNRRK